MLNLFIGVILNSMDETANEKKKEEIAKQRASGKGPTVDQEIEELEEQIEKLTEGLGHLKLRIQTLQKNGNGISRRRFPIPFAPRRQSLSHLRLEPRGLTYRR